MNHVPPSEPQTVNSEWCPSNDEGLTPNSELQTFYANMSLMHLLLALDPALRNTGYAILRNEGTKTRAIRYGVIRNNPQLSMPGCLVEIHRQIDELIRHHRPEACAVEGLIYVQNTRTAITLGAARGSALLAAAQHGLQIFEYAPRRVKQSVVGHGSAQKGQIGFMVRTLLELSETPEADAADALAIGLTHFRMHSSPLSALRGIRAL